LGELLNGLPYPSSSSGALPLHDFIFLAVIVPVFADGFAARS
jgi:hypothetical protein